MQPSSPVSDSLNRLGIACQWIRIPLNPEQKPIRTLEDLVASRGMTPAQIVRSLVFRTGGGGFVLLAAPATARADWGPLRRALGERRLTLAEAEEVLRATGYPVGAVPPLALPEGMRVLVDERVFDHERVIIGSGVLGHAIEMAAADLNCALQGAEVGRFTKPA